jgi:hypothetical protein
MIVARTLNVSVKDARDRVDAGNVCLLKDMYWSDPSLNELREELVALGAEVAFENGNLESRARLPSDADCP